MERISRVQRLTAGAVCFVLASCTAREADSTRRVNTGPEQERVIEYFYNGDGTRDISTHTEDHSGLLDGKSADRYFYQYCEADPQNNGAQTTLTSVRVDQRLPKFGGDRRMKQELQNARECTDGILDRHDEAIPDASPIPPNGQEKEMPDDWDAPKRDY